MQKTQNIDGVDFTVVTLTAKINRSISMFSDSEQKVMRSNAEYNNDILIESLRLGGTENPEEVVDNLADGSYDAKSPYKLLLLASLEVNGYKLEQPKSGEAPAGDGPALTGPSSTQD